MKVSIVLPAHNEEKRIVRTLEEYIGFFHEKKKKKEIDDFELLVVINNTYDKTEEIVKKLSKKYREIKYLNFKQGGKGFAIIEGFKEALKKDGDLIGFVDADMATSPAEYFKLIKGIGNYDAIIASRYVEGAVVPKRKFKRVILSRAGNFVVRILFMMNYKDTQLGAKVLKRNAIKSILPELGITNWAFDIDLLYTLKRKGFKTKEFPTLWEEKSDSKLNIKRDSTRFFFAALRLRMLNSHARRFWQIISPIAGRVWRAIK